MFGFDPSPGNVKNIIVLYDDEIFIVPPENILSVIRVSEQVYKLYFYTEQASIFSILNKFKLPDNYDLSEIHLLLPLVISSQDRVLQLGAYNGVSACIIAGLLNISTADNLVLLESNPEAAKMLTSTLKTNNITATVIPAALSQNTEMMVRKYNNLFPSIEPRSPMRPIPAQGLPEGWAKVNTIRWSEIQGKFTNLFTVLVATCNEGLFYAGTDIYSHFNKVIIENDYHDMYKKHMIDEILRAHGFILKYQQPGGWGPCKNCFYEFWEKKNVL
jgi:hypothetical protein